MAEEGKKTKLVLPKTFDKCPHCGSAARFCPEALKGDIPAEEMEKEQPVLFSFEYNAQPSGRLYPVKLMALMDVCVECGTVYAISLMRFVGRPALPGGGNGGRRRP